MAKTKRVQVLMEPAEFEALERIARARGASVSELMRRAVWHQHLSQQDQARRANAARRFLELPDMKLPAWPALKQEIEERYEDALP
jgi:hypothetical protein